MSVPRISSLRAFAFVCSIACVLAACSSEPRDEGDEHGEAGPLGPPGPGPFGTLQQPVWVNGDFESDAIGTAPPTSWTLTTNINNGITDTRPAPQTLASLNLAAGGVAFTQVVGGATETQLDPDMPLLGTTLRFPKYGNRAARINSTGVATGLNRNVNSIKQTMTVSLGDIDATDNKAHVRFAIAPVLENPAHTYVQQPYYFVRLQNITRGTTLYSDFNISGQQGVPWKTFTDTSGNSAQYTDWMLVDVAPGNAALAVGDQVELLIIAAGCSAGGHWGRLYVDGIGSGVPGLFAWASGPQQANAGSTITYTINYKNGGTTTTNSTRVDLNTPPNTTFQSTSLGAACTAPAVGGTGTVSCPIGTLAPGATGSYTITVNIPAATPNGTVILNGDYSIYATGVNPLIGPKVYTTVTSSVQYADVGVTLSDGIAAIGWGQPTTYQLVLTNTGPVAAPTVNVADTMPAQLTNVTWTCSGTGGGSCTAASGSGNIASSVSLPVGATARYVISANIIAGSGSGQVVHTATATVAGGISDPDTTNNTAVDTNAIGNLRTLTVNKTGAIAGGSVTSTPAAISCGAGCSSANGQFLEGSQVQLTAAPVAGAVFNGWGGACSGTATTCTVTVSSDLTVTAAFTGPTVTITGGNNQATGTSSAFLFPLSVQVTDANGLAVVGAVVTFTPPASGASATLSSTTAATNLFGIATVNATANNSAGSYQVSASVPGATPVNFNLTNIGTPSSVTVSSGSPQSTVVSTAFGAPLVARVRDAANQPVGGVTVTFTAPGSGASATLSSATAVTDANGLAQVTATANTITGSYNVTATVGLLNASFALTNTPGAPATLNLIAPTTRSATVNTSQGTFTAEIIDSFGNVVPGVTVTFAVPASGASATLSAASAVTGANGRASVTGTANTVAGSYVVTASATGVTSKTFSVTNTPGAAASLTLISGGSQSATIGAAFAAPLVARVRDAFGNNVPGVSVAFSAPASGASATVPATLTTDANGLVSASATAGTVAGSYNVTATVTGISPITFALTNTPGAPAAISVVSGGTQSTAVNTAFATPLVVRVVDAQGNNVPGATVTFTRPASGASATLSATTVTTGANGQAQVTATANTITGSYNVTAAVAGVATPATFALTNTPGTATTLTLIAPTTRSATVNTSQGTFTAELTDAFGNVVPGVTVTFAVPASGASATLSAASAVTGANGRASITATANTVAGAYSLTASATGVPSQAFSVTNTPGAASSLTLVSGSGQSATIGAAFAAPLVARVRDAFGNNVPGVSVAFSAPASGASATVPATLTTDANGLVSASATANTVAGSYNVTATVTGISPITFALTNTPGAPAAISVVSGGTQSTAVNTAFAAPLVVRVVDASGNNVPGATVTFTRPASGASATLSSTTVTTGANGQAQVTATANTITGTYNVTAAVAGVATPATFALTNTPGTATTLTLIAPTTRSATVNTSQGTFTAEVTDAFGNVVPGVTVTFAVPASGASATLSAASAVTGANGRASITATANTVAGAYSLTASATGVPSQAFSVTNTPGAAATLTVVSGSDQSATVDDAFAAPLVVRVRDAFGNNVPDALVVFTPPATGATAIVTPTVATDANGLASTPATAGTVAGTYTVAASVGGAAPVAFPLTNTAGAPAAIEVSSGSDQDAEVTTDFEAPLVARVVDSHGNPVPNATVTFAAPGDGASAALSATTVTTGADGRAQVLATANTVAGPYAVTATVPGAAAPASFALTNTAGAPAEITVVSGSEQSAEIEAAFAEPLVVRVRDAHGNLVPNATVTFTAPADGASAAVSTTVTTGSDGLAQTAATANPLAGNYEVVASVAGVTATAVFALENTAGAPTAIEVSSGSAQETVVDTAFAAPLIARVLDRAGNPVPGVTVRFLAPGASPTAQLSANAAQTDSEGLARVTAEADLRSGSYAVTAELSPGVTATFALKNLPDAPAQIIVAPQSSPQAATVLDEFVEPLAVQVVDRFGNPVPGAIVSFAAPAGGATAALSSPTATTDADGRCEVLATASAVAGSYLVTASVPGVANAAPISLTNLAGAAALVSLEGGSGQSTEVDTDFAEPLTVLVVDAQGNPVPNAIVAFGASTDAVTAVLSASSVATGADGRASVTARASTAAGAHQVTAVVVGAAAPVVFDLTNTPGAPAAVIASPGATPQQTQVGTPYGRALTVTVVDRFDNPVPGATVTYAVPGSGATGALSATSATSDAGGQAQVFLTAGTVAGSFAATATVTGVEPASFDLTNLAGPAHNLVMVSGDEQTAEVDTAFAAPLVLRVVDEFGNPVAGELVSFAAPEDGATATIAPTSATSDAQGLVSVAATAGTVTGSYHVAVTSALGALPVLIELANTPGAPAAAVAVPGGTPQSAEVGSAFGAPLSVIVTDRFGNRVPGVVLTFTSATGPGAVLSAPTATTDADGNAQVLAIADGVTGSYQISVQVPGLAEPVIFELTNTPSAVRYIIVDSGSGQSTMATTAFTAPLVFRVLDSFGNPVAGVALSTTMTRTGPGAAMTTSSAISDATGRVRYDLVANDRVGMFAVTATAAATSGTATAVLVIVPVPTETTISMPARVPVNRPATVQVRVTALLGTPSGSVEILDEESHVLGTATLVAGSAEVSVELAARGALMLAARYPAQGMFGASRSATAGLEVDEDEGSLNGTVACSSGGNAGGLVPLGAAVLLLGLRRRGAQRATRATARSAARAPAAATFVVGVLAGLGVLGGLAALAPPAHAEDYTMRSINRFHAASAESSWFAVDSLEFDGHVAVALSATADYARKPLAIYEADEMTRTVVVESSLLAHLGASVTLRDNWRLSTSVPMAIYQDGNDGTYNGMALPKPSFAFGDMQLSADLRAYGGRHSAVRAAVGLRVTLPTGQRSDYMSDSEFAFEPRGLLAVSRGRLELGASLGAFLRQKTELADEGFGSELRYTASAGVRLLDQRLLLGPEVIGAVSLVGDSSTGSPTEVGAGGHYRLRNGMLLGLGATAGIINAVGVPDLRLFLSASGRL